MKRTLLVLALALAGCETTPERTYWDLMNEPIPENDAERDRQCAWLRAEMARMQSVGAAAVNSQFALAFQARARDNIAALQSRYHQIQCDSIRIGNPSRMSFDQCFSKCRDLTGRTEAECFDSCK